MNINRAMPVLFSMILISSAQAQQANIISYSLKSGESIELSNLYLVANCRSILTATPEVTILDGPPGVTVKVDEAMVVPRVQQCAKPVKGAKLFLKADTIEDESTTRVTLRIKCPTKDGVREQSLRLDLSLFP